MDDNRGRGIFKKTKKIIAIGDLHGDMMQLLSILYHSKMIEKINKERMCINEEDFKIDKWRWIGGNTYIVQMGDIFDGGGRKEIDEFDDKEVEILIFLMRLKKHAKNKGGDVLIIFGNHEYMNFNNNYNNVFTLKTRGISNNIYYKPNCAFNYMYKQKIIFIQSSK